MQDQVVLLQKSVEFIEQLPQKTFLCQFLLESPYCFLVGHLVAAGQSEEVAERESVADLVFRLRVAEMVNPLQHHDLEHQHVVIRFRAHLGELFLIEPPSPKYI